MRPLLFLILASCTPVPVVEEDPTPICDGILQIDEGSVIDSTFDKDNDGFKDKNETACHDVYDPDRLDCNDDDANIRPDVSEISCNYIDDDCNELTEDSHDSDNDGTSNCDDCDDGNEFVFPGATEVCWDGLDNDCDTIVDNDCGEDYNGNFAIDPVPQYSCSLNFVQIDFDEMAIIYSPPYVTMWNVGGIQPGSMDGDIDNLGVFSLNKLVDLGTNFDCNEEYRLFGEFSDADHFEATLQANFTGVCLNCEFQEWTFSGTRIDTTTTY